MDVFVYTIPLPGKVKECVTQNEDGSYTVFIKDTLSQADRARALEHARRHIECLHFEGNNVQEIEIDARRDDYGETISRDPA